MYWHRKLAYYRGVTTQTDGRGGGGDWESNR